MPNALVTGASSGIGLELARLLGRDGYNVTLAARSAAALSALADELGDARAIAVDLSKPDGPGVITDALGSVDVLVNNAGVGDYGPFAEADTAKTRSMIELNIASLTALTRFYLPGMLVRGSGRIMNVASTAAFQPGPLMAVYYATKSYVLSFSEAIAEETRGSGVTVTALCPGPTASGFQAGAAMEDSKLVAGRKLPTAAHVAAVGYKAMQRGDVIEVVGGMNRVMAAAVRVSPRPVLRRMVHRMQAAKP